MVIDRAGKKMYVNLTAVSTVGVVDLQSGKLTTQWPIAAKVQNSMALDEANHRLFIATTSVIAQREQIYACAHAKVTVCHKQNQEP
jgi:Tfp pilus assembly protein PilN